MESNWHHAFNPQSFLKRVDLERLLQRNEAFAENHIQKLGKPCIFCQSFSAPGLLLNEGSYLCAQCFDRISLIQYPEKYEDLRRKYLVAREARKLARQSLIKHSIALKLSGFVSVVFWLSLLTLISLVLYHIGVIAYVVNGVFVIGCYSFSKKLKSIHENKLKEWDEHYAEPSEPLLRHFHDPNAELTTQDRAILYIFNHWPGYPPFWSYLREIVLKRDNRRCQVTGCPSRLELHIHHIQPIAKGGEHVPENLVALCDFHHALEPEQGHQRIWEDIKTRYFTLVRAHERSNRTVDGFHIVRAHLRRLQLISGAEIQELKKTYGLSCPDCSSTDIDLTLHASRNIVEVECSTCAKSVQGPQQLTEETGPRLAEILRVTRNQGRWKARWDMLSQRQNLAWGEWRSSRQTTKKRDEYKRRVVRDSVRPLCPKCGAPMRIIRPKPTDTWKLFWGCSQFRVTGCKGAVRYVEPKGN